VKRQDLIRPETRTIARTTPVNGKISAIEFMQAVVGGKPHKAIPVLDDRIHGVGTQPITRADGGEIQMAGLRRHGQFSKQAKEQQQWPRYSPERAHSFKLPEFINICAINLNKSDKLKLLANIALHETAAFYAVRRQK
jgi:hypothetical protein